MFNRYASELIRHGGDIDNRVKTLFDALRMPSLDELPKRDVPKRGEEPFYVLLEDDALVTGFSVITDRLLIPTASEGQVELIIHVKVSTTRSSMDNIGL